MSEARSGCASESPTIPSRDERRVGLRFPSLLEAVCKTPGQRFGPLSCSARVWDISTGGVCLVVSRRFEPGTTLLMELDLGPLGSSPTLRAQVVHVAPHTDNLWFVGCEFAQSLSDQELKMFL